MVQHAICEHDWSCCKAEVWRLTVNNQCHGESNTTYFPNMTLALFEQLLFKQLLCYIVQCGKKCVCFSLTNNSGKQSNQKKNNNKWSWLIRHIFKIKLNKYNPFYAVNISFSFYLFKTFSIKTLIMHFCKCLHDRPLCIEVESHNSICTMTFS